MTHFKINETIGTKMKWRIKDLKNLLEELFRNSEDRYLQAEALKFLSKDYGLCLDRLLEIAAEVGFMGIKKDHARIEFSEFVE